ncbi:MAG: 4Fe-4S binding protein [Promethearchaeota archaeon]
MTAPLKDLIHREGDPGDFIIFNEEKCSLCKMCTIVCPVNLWIFKNGKISIQGTYKDLCLECGSCWQICDTGAIDFHYPKGGTGVIFKRG